MMKTETLRWPTLRDTIKIVSFLNTPITTLGKSLRSAIDIVLTHHIDDQLKKAEKRTRRVIKRNYKQMAILMAINLFMAIVAVVLNYFQVTQNWALLCVALIYMGLMLRFLVALILFISKKIGKKKKERNYLFFFIGQFFKNNPFKGLLKTYKETCRNLFDRLYREKIDRKLQFAHKISSVLELSMNQDQLFEVVYTKIHQILFEILLSRFIIFGFVFLFYIGLGFLFRIALFDTFYHQNLWQVLIYPVVYLWRLFF